MIRDLFPRAREIPAYSFHPRIMEKNTGQNRRRSLRNKTIAIDTRSIFVDPIKGRPVMKVGASGSVGVSGVPSTQTEEGVVDTRSYSFTDLVSAFHMIEKRACQDPQEAFKRFRINDVADLYTQSPSEVQRDVAIQSFPKISENPFLRSEYRSRYGNIEESDASSITRATDYPAYDKRSRQSRFNEDRC